METYYFHIRDNFGVVEDTDGVELPSMAALLAEVLRSVNELSRDVSPHPSMRFEIADFNGRTVLVAQMQGSTAIIDLIPRPVKPNPSHEGEGRTVWYSAYRFSLSGCGINGGMTPTTHQVVQPESNRWDRE